MNQFQEQCAPYWPESGASTYSDMTVTSVSAVEAKEFTIRVFKLTDQVRPCTVIIVSVTYNMIPRIHHELIIMLSNKIEPSVK